MSTFRCRPSFLLLAALACLLPGAAASATEFFVSVDGNDTAAGTRAQPWATVDRALAQVAPGDTVTVRGGVGYVEVGEVATRRQ